MDLRTRVFEAVDAIVKPLGLAPHDASSQITDAAMKAFLQAPILSPPAPIGALGELKLVEQRLLNEGLALGNERCRVNIDIMRSTRTVF